MRLLFVLLVSFFVQSQKDFDMLQERIDAAFEAGENGIDIRLDSTVFFFRENHLSFIDRSMPDFSINISGKGAVIVGESDDSPYDIGKGFVDLDTLSDFDPADDVKWARFWPIKVPFKKDIWCIPVREPDMSEGEAKDVNIVLSQWFQGKIYKVIKISGGWMYFRRDDKTGTGIYTELRYGRCLPRYILCRPPKSNDYHCCSASKFLTVQNSRLGNLSIRDVKFLGNSFPGDPDKDILLYFRSTSLDSLIIENCAFEGIRSDVITLLDTDNLRYRNNFMKRCYRSGVKSDALSDNCHITGNTFIGNGRMMVHNCNIRVQGHDVMVSDNYLEDFTYIGIGAGSYYASEMVGAKGIICGNELCSSAQFWAAPPRMLIDAGAIYCWTRNEDLVISDNYVHDIYGAHGNRGIFGDDGAVNLTIRNNRVMNISSSHCISLRKVKRLAWRRKSKIKKVNIGNKIFDNVYDGKINIYVDPSDPSSYAYNNVKISGK